MLSDRAIRHRLFAAEIIEALQNVAVRIATWNLMRPAKGGERRAALMRHLAQQNADVWVLTETRLDLSPGDDYSLVASSTPAPDRRPEEMWTAIWSRLPAVPLGLVAEPDRSAAADVEHSTLGTVRIVGTVLPWLTDRRTPLRGAAAFTASVEDQQQDWTRLQRNAGGKFVLAGDFNQCLAGPHAYGSGKGRAFLLRVLEEEQLSCATAGAADPVAKLSGRSGIDHICIGRDLRAAAAPTSWPSSSEVGRRLTDHYGVVVEVAAVL